jgi:hypothetical protein
MKNFNTKNIIINLLGFLIIIFFFWTRFLRRFIEKKSLYFIPLYVTKGLLLFCLLIYCYFIYSAIKIIFDYKKKNQIIIHLENNVVIKYIISCLLVFKNSPKTFYKTLIYSKFNMAIIIEKPVYALAKLFAKKPKDIIYLSLSVIPRVAIATLFIISLFFFNTLLYFFTSLCLLILPLFYNIYYYITDHLCDENISYFSDHLIFKESKNKGFLKVEFAPYIPDYPDAQDIITHKNNNELLDWFAYNFDVYTNIKNFLIKLKKVEDKYKPYENLYVYSCYIIGWSTILYTIW